MTALTWFKSSYSSNEGPECVEVAISPTALTVHVRDSKNPTDPHLTLAATTWSAFLTHLTK
ncbi:MULTISPECIES: DUF397 domain-containing protein [unclassified Streptomyces]|uniref:DUF397 domain-containing protein n=1 Tax=unclassified Streptomyces TaxID=2593676 RepID=UPI001661AC0A|nr:MULTISPECIES: DUF397 domain-containing protein [unclassified Streptomyces]MBD0844299.1 DUF397 domain-containing protein [Streptomyces sp. TRM68416]